MEKGVPIRSISRSISILQAINRHGSLSMMSIAKQGFVPYPTACRIVQTLIHEGLVEQEPTRKRYRATALVQSLAYGYQASNNLVSVGRPYIRALTKEIGWPISLAARVGTRMIVRDSTHAETSLTFEHYYPGFTLPLLDCASGRLCLAYMSDEELQNTRQWLPLGTGATMENIHLCHVFDSLQQVRDQGYFAQSWGQHNLTPGKTSSVAVPIFRSGRFEAALTMIYFASAMKPIHAIERHLEALKESAVLISALLDDDRVMH